MGSIGNSLLISSFLLEGILAGMFFIWASFKDFKIILWPNQNEILFGIFLCLPLFLINYLLFGPLSHKIPALKMCYEFKDKVVRPLAESLNYKSSLFIAACAAIGEELFFRGFIQTELGILSASLLFSLLHFGPAAKRYALIAFLYFLIGIYFGVIVRLYSSLWIAIITHAFYDYIALIYMKYIYVSPEKIVKDNSSSFINGVRPV